MANELRELADACDAFAKADREVGELGKQFEAMKARFDAAAKVLVEAEQRMNAAARAYARSGR